MAYSASLAKTLSQIGKLQETLERLVQLPRAVATAAEPKINRLIQDEFDSGRDPYGRPWARLKPSTLAKGRTPPPLTDTRKLRNGTKVYAIRANYAGLRVVVGEPYGYFHQVGTAHMARRKIVPDQGLPRGWVDILNAEAKRIAKGAA